MQLCSNYYCNTKNNSKKKPPIRAAFKLSKKAQTAKCAKQRQ